jgi:hypothetical protein
MNCIVILDSMAIKYSVVDPHGSASYYLQAYDCRINWIQSLFFPVLFELEIFSILV